MESNQEQFVFTVFEHLFKERGLPRTIRTIARGKSVNSLYTGLQLERIGLRQTKSLKRIEVQALEKQPADTLLTIEAIEGTAGLMGGQCCLAEFTVTRIDL